MYKVSQEAIIRANERTKSSGSFSGGDAINVSMNYNGNTYSKKITLQEAKTAFGEAMSKYGKML